MASSSGNALFDRRCRLTIANPVATPNDFRNTTTEVIEIAGGVTDKSTTPGLRIVFKITKTLKKEPNTSQITVTNLSPARRSSLQHKGVKVLFEAGYKQTGVNQYFSGDVSTIDHVREGADWNTVMRLGDGERAWQFARINESFAPRTRAADVLRKLADAMGLEIGNVDQQALGVNGVLDQGFAAVGSASHALDQFVKSLRKTWSVQDGQIQILDRNQALDLPIPELSPSSGLIGSPEMGSPKKKGEPALLKFKALLTPVKPGGKVKLVSERYNGFIRVEAVTFSGDSSGGDWYSEMSGSILQ